MRLSWNMFSKILTIIHSFLIGRKLKHCGHGFRIYFPAMIMNPREISIGDNVSVACHSWLNCIGPSSEKPALRIGNGCYIGRFAHINAFNDVTIEDHVLMADRIHISDCSHMFSDPEIPIMHQEEKFLGKVLIKRGAWIGCGAVILPGVTVGKNAVVAANAVVTKNVPDDHVARGNPAQVFPKKKRGMK